MAYPNDANTVLLMHFENLADSSVGGDGGSKHGNATAAGNAAVTTDQKKFGSYSLGLDGTGDYVKYGDHADWNFGTGTLAIDLWWYPTSDVTADFCGQWDSATAAWYFYYYRLISTRRLYFAAYSTSTLINFYVDYTPTLNTWQHISVVRGWAGGANTWSINANGVSLGTETASITMPDLSSDLYIGYIGNGANELTGYMDELRIVKGAARWTANFDPPTIPYPDTARWMGKVNNITNPAKLHAVALTGASKINQVATRGA